MIGIVPFFLCVIISYQGQKKEKTFFPNFCLLKINRGQAYLDRPYKRQYIHISAPHMYVTVLEAMSLQPGQSFLNIGSGSGYLCCLAAFLVGETGLVQGVEINSAAVQHSKPCCERWRQQLSQAPYYHHFRHDFVQIFEGDIFALDMIAQVRGGARFDRVYVGAACPQKLQQMFLPLLRDDGVLITPILETHQLLRIRRVCGDVFEQTVLGNVHFAPLQSPSAAPMSVSQLLPNLYAHHNIVSTLLENEADDAEEEEEDGQLSSDADGADVLQKVWSLDADNLLICPASVPDHSPTKPRLGSTWVLPRDTWSPVHSMHARYPTEFKRAVYSLLLCVSLSRGSLSAMQRVPVAVWLHLISYMSRDWFAREYNETNLLQCELLAEKKLHRQTQKQLREAQQQRRAAERERDLLRIIVARHTTNANSNYDEEVPLHGIRSRLASAVVSAIAVRGLRRNPSTGGNQSNSGNSVQQFEEVDEEETENGEDESLIDNEDHVEEHQSVEQHDHEEDRDEDEEEISIASSVYSNTTHSLDHDFDAPIESTNNVNEQFSPQSGEQGRDTSIVELVTVAIDETSDINESSLTVANAVQISEVEFMVPALPAMNLSLDHSEATEQAQVTDANDDGSDRGNVFRTNLKRPRSIGSNEDAIRSRVARNDEVVLNPTMLDNDAQSTLSDDQTDHSRDHDSTINSLHGNTNSGSYDSWGWCYNNNRSRGNTSGDLTDDDNFSSYSNYITKRGS